MVENLLIALDDEFKAYAFYAQANALQSPFGYLFANLQNAEERHIAMLSVHLQNLNGEIPSNPYLGVSLLPNTLDGVLQVALQNEWENIALYNRLIESEQNANVINTFYHLQAASYNNHIPALQNALAQVQNPQNPQNFLESLNGGKELLNEAGQMVAQLKEGTLSQGELEGFLQKLNYSLVGGVVAGAFGVIILNEFLQRNKE